MSRPNVIPSGIQPQPKKDEELERAVEAVCLLIRARAGEVADRLIQAEEQFLERLSQFVPSERLLTVKEAAAYLHLSPRTVDEWTRSGVIPKITFVQIGGEKRFRLADLNRYLESNTVRPKQIKL